MVIPVARVHQLPTCLPIYGCIATAEESSGQSDMCSFWRDLSD